jgi:hypothetical protein
LNEALRKALNADIEKLDLTQFEKTIDSRALLQKLCHTPHFLEKADRNGMRKSVRKMSAYETPDHF